MRKLYETNTDRFVQELIADTLRSAWSCALTSTPPKYPYDFVAERAGAITAIIEVKNRNMAHDKFTTYMISIDKLATCSMAASVMKVPFFLVVSFNDKLMFWQYDPDDFHCEIGGRADRDDTSDLEPVAHIPMASFKEIVQ